MDTRSGDYTIRLARPDEVPRLREIEDEAGMLFLSVGRAAEALDDSFPADELARLVGMRQVWVASRLEDDRAVGAPYHLELTRCRAHPVAPRPTEEDLLVLYLPDSDGWALRCEAMRAAGFVAVPSFNPYWDRRGRTFQDPDGYRIVLQQAAWLAEDARS